MEERTSDEYYQDQALNYEEQKRLDEYLVNQPDTSENINQFETQDFADINFLDYFVFSCLPEICAHIGHINKCLHFSRVANPYI